MSVTRTTVEDGELRVLLAQMEEADNPQETIRKRCEEAGYTE